MFVQGLVYLIISQIIVVLSGFLINFGLARYFGPGPYGTYSVVVSIVLWAEIFVVAGIPVALQKFVAERTDALYTIIRRTRKVQFGYSVLIATIFFLLSPAIARLFDAPKMSFFLKLVSVDIVLQGLYRFYWGIQNGLRKFSFQALIVVCYTMSRLLATVLFVMVGFSLPGALAALLVGSLIGWGVGVIATGTGKREADFDMRPLFGFCIPNIFYTALMNLFLYVDLWSVRYYLGDISSGYYNAAALVSRLPYFMFFALSGVLLPTVSRSIYQNELKATRRYIHHSLRFLLLIFVPAIVLILSSSKELITLLYTVEYTEATEPLRILFIGMSFVTVLLVLNAVVIADNKMKKLSLITMVFVVVDVVLNIHLVPRYGLKGAAFATAMSGLVGMITVSCMIFRRFGTCMPASSFFKYMVAGALLYPIVQMVKVEGMVLIPYYLSLFCLYCVFLVGLGEIAREDVLQLKKLLKSYRITSS